MKPPLRRRRILASITGAFVTAGLAWAGWWGYTVVTAQPLRHVVFAGDVDRLQQADLEAFSRAVLAAGTPSLEAVREAALRVPWVRDATVRRRFPDAAEVTFEAHEAFAHWNEGQLVSSRGEIFTAEGAAALPRLRGPDTAAAAMAAEFPRFAASLAPLGIPVAELRLSARGAWQVVLGSGLVLELGRTDAHARAQRFAAAWPQVAPRAAEFRYADLRYPNGFAVGMDPASRAPAPSPLSTSRPRKP